MGSFVAAAVIAAIGGTIKGSLSYQSAQDQYEALEAEAKYNAALLELDKEAAQSEYLSEMEELENSLAQTRETNSRSIAATSASRAANAEISAASAVATQQDSYAELATIQAQGIQDVGEENQKAAVSGFRKSEGTTQAANVENAEEEAATEYSNTLRSIKANSYVNYLSATADWTDSTYQLEQYKQNIRDAVTNYETESESLTSEINYETEKYDYMIEYYNSMAKAYSSAKHSFWTGLSNFFGGSVDSYMMSADELVNAYEASKSK